MHDYIDLICSMYTWSHACKYTYWENSEEVKVTQEFLLEFYRLFHIACWIKVISLVATKTVPCNVSDNLTKADKRKSMIFTRFCCCAYNLLKKGKDFHGSKNSTDDEDRSPHPLGIAASKMRGQQSNEAEIDSKPRVNSKPLPVMSSKSEREFTSFQLAISLKVLCLL